MSRRCVGYEGEGRGRRPVYVDEGPAAAHVDGIGALGRLSALGIAGLDSSVEGAGAVERRQLYDAQDDIRAEEARAARQSPATARYTPEQLLERRQRSQAAMRATTTPKAPPQEATPMTDDARQPDPDELPPSTFTELAAAALQAARAQQEADAAHTAAQIADERLAAALADIEGVWAKAGLPGPLVAVEAAPEPVKAPAANKPATSLAGTPRPARIPGELTARQAQVVAAVRSAGGSIKDAAKALGTSDTNVRVTLYAVGDKGLLDADLVTMLPSGYAKYATTVAA